MSDKVYKPYLGSGQVYARIAGAAVALLAIGNCSMLEPSVKEDKQTLKDYTKPGGGTYASVSRIDTVTVKLKLHDLNKTNVARAVFGSESAVTGATVIDEVVIGYKGGLTPLAHVNPTAVVVTDSTAVTTYVPGVDYEVKGGGLLILDAGAITDAQSLKVDYTFAAYNKVEAMTTGAVILELHFEGLNEADSGKPVILDVWRAQLSPTKALSLLGDKFSDLDLEAEVLKDPSKTGTGISQYFRVKMA
jgi:hypothetical protein